MVDNMRTQRFASLFNLPETAKYSFYDADVSLINLDYLIKDVSVIIHLAAITDAANSFNNASEVELNNYKATEKVADLCVRNNVPLILISSTSVYGTQLKIVSENCKSEDLKPQSPYAETKLKEEKLIQMYCQRNHLKATILRFGTIFGTSTGMRFHTAVNKFCWQAVMKQPLTVWSDAYDQKRPYLDIEDASNAIIFIIKENIYDGKIYNILTENSTVRNVVEIIKELCPNLKIEFVNNIIMNQLSYEVSRDLFVSQGFRFSGNLKRGIKETISLLKQSCNNYE